MKKQKRISPIIFILAIIIMFVGGIFVYKQYSTYVLAGFIVALFVVSISISKIILHASSHYISKLEYNSHYYKH